MHQRRVRFGRGVSGASAASRSDAMASQLRVSACAHGMPVQRQRLAAGVRQSSSRQPVTPGCTTASGASLRNAATGVPQAMASSITRPKGVGQAGNTNTSAAW